MRPDPFVPPSPAWLVAAALAGLFLAACSGGPRPGAEYRQVAGGDPARGRLLMARYQCGTCHAVPEVPSDSVRVAPPLEAFGKRSYIAGKIPNTPATLQRWVRSPRSLVPDTRMPDLGVTEPDARDIAAYLLSLS